MKGNGPVAVAGIPHGVPGGTGPMNATGKVAGPVNLGQNTPPPMPKPVGPTATAKSAPKVLFKPKPEYTVEAKQLHIEGNVTVRIRVSSSGSVQVLAVTSDLGHGLGDSAVLPVQATRFSPPPPASSPPSHWKAILPPPFP